ncbi:hypothetical protein [Lentilactobacillus sp. Marseille-Q4993]|uniref:hypothetical protein n=1 Tax=Lentilactobacillus sp. Marseille-Q4993 TaxID=3039492 RepID=UPI0024BC5785|nr:hypothetical protein [Lentilactobacillus sp. Marseille-Q4993]
MAEEETATKQKINFSGDQVKKAAQMLEEQGYFTKLDFPEMKDYEWTKQFEERLRVWFQDSKDNPYLYYERFDFVGGDIDSIIFNMDIIKTREAALEKLGEVLNEKIG